MNWLGPVPLSLPHARPTWVGSYTCCSPARAPVAEGGKRCFFGRCPLRWPRVPRLKFYIARGCPTPAPPAGMSLPFSSHIWMSGTRDPSPGQVAAWAPARVPYADQRRSGLAGAQVTRAGPYMARLPCRSALTDPARCRPQGRGAARVTACAQPACLCACAPAAAPVGPARAGRCGRASPRSARSGALAGTRAHRREEGATSQGAGAAEEQSRPLSGQGRKGPSPGGFLPLPQSRGPVPPPRGGAAAVLGPTTGRGRGGGSRGTSRAPETCSGDFSGVSSCRRTEGSRSRGPS